MQTVKHNGLTPATHVTGSEERSFLVTMNNIVREKRTHLPIMAKATNDNRELPILGHKTAKYLSS